MFEEIGEIRVALYNNIDSVCSVIIIARHGIVIRFPLCFIIMLEFRTAYAWMMNLPGTEMVAGAFEVLVSSNQSLAACTGFGNLPPDIAGMAEIAEDKDCISPLNIISD